MPRLRLRLKLWGMMLTVALVGLGCVWGRDYWLGRSRGYRPSPVRSSTLDAIAAHRGDISFAPGGPVLVDVKYKFALGGAPSPPGTSYMMLAKVWLEDQATGVEVDSYSFDALIAKGGREATSGSFVYDAKVPRPGRYMVQHLLTYRDVDGLWRFQAGGGTSCNVVDPGPKGTGAGGLR